ncbi:tail fiber assembly protein [Enterobacteriaceae bacterium RIT814]|nr:tail fiber assembly protein [Enterobacteriaceae bacterium RIT 814]
MSLIFDGNGFALVAGEIRVYYHDPLTGEYKGWSDEYINIGVSLPGCSTELEPQEYVKGKVPVFTGTKWVLKEDHRGETEFSTSDGYSITVDYIGPIREGFTLESPASSFDKWEDGKWVANPEAQHAFEVVSAESRQKLLIAEANAHMNSKQWPGKAAIGRLKGDELVQYGNWLDYLDALGAVDISSAPDIHWPIPPEV